MKIQFLIFQLTKKRFCYTETLNHNSEIFKNRFTGMLSGRVESKLKQPGYIDIKITSNLEFFSVIRRVDLEFEKNCSSNVDENDERR